MSYNGPERRKMNQDQIDRDRLLSEVHADMKHLIAWSKEHDDSDTTRFEKADKRIAWVEKVAYVGMGGLAVLNIILKAIK